MRSLVLCFKALIFDRVRITGAKTIANVSVWAKVTVYSMSFQQKL